MYSIEEASGKRGARITSRADLQELLAVKSFLEKSRAESVTELKALCRSVHHTLRLGLLFSITF